MTSERPSDAPLSRYWRWSLAMLALVVVVGLIAVRVLRWFGVGPSP